MSRSWKIPSRRGSQLFRYLNEGRQFQASNARLGDYMTRFKGQAWGAGASRIRFAKGRHAGKTLAEIGINEHTFNALADGYDPNRTERLIPPGPDGRHVVGFDHQFGVPKSLSVAAMNREQRPLILRAHQRAVKAAFKVLEQAEVCRIPLQTPKGERLCRSGRPSRTQGSDTRAVPGELIAFATTHWVSRPTQETLERGPDPQLHTHVFVFNMAWAEGQFRAVDHRGLVHQARYAEAVYQANLAHELAQAGIHIDPFEDAKGLRTFQLAGADPEVDRFYSSRHREITQKIVAFELGYGRPPTKEEWEELRRQFSERNGGRFPSRKERARLMFEFEHGHGRPPTDEEESQIVRSGRMPKETGDGEPDFESQIRALGQAGMKLPEVVRASHYDPYEAPKEERQAEVLAEALKYLHTRSGSTFARYEVAPAIWHSSIGRLRPEEVEELLEEVDSSGELVTVGHHKHRANERVTTRTQLCKEERLLSRLLSTARQPAPAPGAEHVEAAIADEESRLRKVTGKADAHLHEEQRKAIAYLAEPVRWQALEGYAGSGKTACCRPLVDAYRRAGLVDKVILVSTAGRTAKASARKVGADLACTVERLDGMVKRGKLRLDERCLVIVDEAAMMDTDRAAVLVDDTRRCIVRTIGDPAQAEAIGAGGWYQEADERLGHVTLSQVQRQRDAEDRQVCLDIREGRAQEALDSLDRRGRFHVDDTHAEAVGRLVADYGRRLDAGCQPKELMVVTDTANVEIDRLNRLLQDARERRGQLSGPSLEVVDLNAGRTERLRKGDRVIFTCNLRQKNSPEVLNGTLGEVVAIDQKLRAALVQLEDEEDAGKPLQVRVPLPHLEPHQTLRLAYAGYVNSTQGGEAAKVMVLPSGNTTNIHTAYTMGSRAVEELDVYASLQIHGEDPKAALAQRWSRPTDKQTATRLLRMERREQVPRSRPMSFEAETQEFPKHSPRHLRETPEEAQWHRKLVAAMRQSNENRLLVMTKARPEERQALLQRLNMDMTLAFQAGTLGTQAMARLQDQAGKLRLCPRGCPRAGIAAHVTAQAASRTESHELTPEPQTEDGAPGIELPPPEPHRRHVEREVVEDESLYNRQPGHWKQAWKPASLLPESPEQPWDPSFEQPSPPLSFPRLRPPDHDHGLGIGRDLVRPTAEGIQP